VSVIFTVPVTLKRRTVSGQDALGNDVFTTVDVSLAGVFAPGGSLEQLQGQDVVTDQPSVFLPTGTAVDAVDAVAVNGLLYEVDGEPNVWPPHPFTGWQPEYSVEVKLRKVTG
jgi:hypothetical protein